MKSIPNIAFSALLFLAIYSDVNAQCEGYITLRGYQFYDECDQPFYPMLINYYVDLAYDPAENPPPDDLTHTYFVRAGHYGCTGGYSSSSILNGPDDILQDFNEIKNLGFNTVRLLMVAGKKVWPNGEGFRVPVYNFDAGWDENTREILTIDPPYTYGSNPNMTFFFDKILEVINIANSVGLKIMLPTSNPGYLPGMPQNNPHTAGAEQIDGFAGDAFIQDNTDYYRALAEFINDNAVHNLFAYEPLGEPTYSENSLKPEKKHTKSEACAIAEEWNTAIKNADPNHLTTVGAANIDDAQGAWDPTLMPVDFINAHMYPGPMKYEWLDDPATFLQKATKRYRDKIYIFDNCFKRPYVFAEIAFPGEDKDGGNTGCIYNPYNDDLEYPKMVYGDEEDGAEFIRQTYPLIKSTGASGCGWWDFQNKNWFPRWNVDIDGNIIPLYDQTVSVAKYAENYYGLLRYGDPGSSSTDGYITPVDLRKEAANQFVRYYDNTDPIPFDNDYGPASSTVDLSEPYYNPFMHPANTTVYTDINSIKYYGTVTGHVQDQDENPIIHAVVNGGSVVGVDNNENAVIYTHYTFSDDNGDFILRAYDYDLISVGDPDNPIKDNIIESLTIGAYGAGNPDTRPDDPPNYIQHNFIGMGWYYPYDAFPDESTDPYHTYTLNSLQGQFDNVIDNVTVNIGNTRNFKGLSTLTALNVLIDGNSSQGGHSEMKARNEVNLKPGFQSAWGSEVHIYTEPLFADCSETYNDLGFRPSGSNASNGTNANSSAKEVEIDFHLQDIEVKIYPNPNTGEFAIEVINPVRGNKELHNQVKIQDSFGKEIRNEKFTGNILHLSAPELQPGIYLLRISSNERISIQKFIIIR
jgi:hypothetical protein